MHLKLQIGKGQDLFIALLVNDSVHRFMSAQTPNYDFLDPPAGPDELGRLGPYRIVGLLGQGGMGEVFQAQDGRLKRTVALKVMNKKFAATANSRKRFIEEARSMAAVHHDNVATIFEVGVHNGMPFLAMEMLKGQSLLDGMAGKRQFPWRDVVRVAREVAAGLAAANECGIIHRDIKPGNIWLEEPSGRAKILDFGLALAGNDHLSPRNSVIGSPGYLSPEQARHEPVDDRTDLDALGVVLYQMVTGGLPVTAKSMSGQFIAIICHDIKPIMNRYRNADQPIATGQGCYRSGAAAAKRQDEASQEIRGAVVGLVGRRIVAVTVGRSMVDASEAHCRRSDEADDVDVLQFDRRKLAGK